MTQHTRYLSRWLRPVMSAALGGLLIGACATESLLEIENEVVTPADATGPIGAAALRGAAIRDFQRMYSVNVAVWNAAGSLTDELLSARPGFEAVDQRAINENSSQIPWSQTAALRYSVPVAIRAMRKFQPDGATRKTQIGHLQTLYGFNYVIMGEIYCNGVPLSEIKEDGTRFNDPKPYSNADLFQLAIVQFDSALAELPAGDPLRNLAMIGKARALLDLDKPAEAATAVAAVASTYTFNIEHNASIGSNGNGLFDWIPNSGNFSVPNSGNFSVPNTPEGINGLNWAADPRINVKVLLSSGRQRLGQDGTTPIFYADIDIMRAVDSPVPLATGREARLIEAEASLRAGTPNWLTLLNALRSSSTLAAQLPPLTDPGTARARQDLIFRERAMWMYLTSHRLGDLRRLIRQYGRTEDEVFPTGNYFKGGVYGDDVNMPPTFAENNNPEYKGCTDRKA